MTEFKNVLDKLLKQYVVSNANQLKGISEPRQQDALKELLSQLTSSPLPSRVPDLSTLLPRPAVEWYQVSKQATSVSFTHRQWKIALLRRQVSRDEVYIALIEEAILATQERYLSIQAKVFGDTTRSRLHRQQTMMLYQFEHLLQSVQTSKHLKLDQLNTLVSA